MTVSGAQVAAAQPAPGDVEWLQTFNTIGPLPNRANGITVDALGNVYVVGFAGGALPGQVVMGTGDAFVRKYDSAGSILWTRQFGTNIIVGDEAFGVYADLSGVYVVGSAGALLTDPSSPFQQHAVVRKYDDAGTELWTRQFGGQGTDHATAVFADASGVYVAGFVNRGLPGGSGDTFVRKYDTEGNELWAHQFAAATNDQAFGLTGDATGIYIAGVNGFPGGAGFVRKLDTSGNLLWSREIEGVGTRQALAVTVHESGVYVGGFTSGSLSGQPADLSDAFLRKYDADGDVLWTRPFGGATGQAQALGVAANGMGVFVAGYTDSPLPGHAGLGGADAVVRAYSHDGDLQWTALFGTAGTDRGNAVAVSDAALYVAGTTDGALPGQTGEGRPDAFLRKYDAQAGTEAWTRQFGTVGRMRDGVSAMAVDGDVYVTSSYSAPFAINPGLAGGDLRKYDAGGELVWTRPAVTDGSLGQGAYDVALDPSGVYVVGAVSGTLPGQTSAGGQDIFVRKYDRDGNELWSRQFGTGSNDSGLAVASDATAIYVTGNVAGTLPGQTSNGPGSDAFVRKYDPDGNELWTRQFGTASADSARHVAVHGSAVYVFGTTGGTFPGETKVGFTDMFLRKYDVNGVEDWTRQFGASGLLNVPNDVAADASGAYVVGNVPSALPGQTHLGLSDAVIRKYDAGGNEAWTRQFGSIAGDTAESVVVRGTDVYVAGATFFDDRATFDGYVTKLDPNGAEVWTRAIRTANPDVSLLPSAIGWDSTGLFVAGAYGDGVPPARTAFVARLVATVAAPLTCDADGDTDVDMADLLLIRAANRSRAQPGDPRDGNGDGRINVADVRFCQRRQTIGNGGQVLNSDRR